MMWTMNKIQDKTISVVMPVYNEEENLNNAIDELVRNLGARFSDYEIIVVDDGSTDRSLEIAKAAAVQHFTVRIICHEKNFSFYLVCTSFGTLE